MNEGWKKETEKRKTEMEKKRKEVYSKRTTSQMEAVVDGRGKEREEQKKNEKK